MKNIIFDIGGIIFDDSKANMEKLLNKNCDLLYKSIYGKGFKKCLLGEKTVDSLIQESLNDKNYEEIKYMLYKNNLSLTYPIIKENFEYIKTLKDKYNLYLLSNITEDSYNYVNKVINIEKNFKGGVYSYQEHLVKPDKSIYNLILKKYNLKKEETIFFDDRLKNVEAAENLGIKAILFKSIDDIKNNI